MGDVQGARAFVLALGVGEQHAEPKSGSPELQNVPDTLQIGAMWYKQSKLPNK